jgi:hypothetical protein
MYEIRKFGIFRRSKVIPELIIYFMFSLPMGVCINVLHTGRFFRGTFTYTLFIALLMRAFDNGSGIE